MSNTYVIEATYPTTTSAEITLPEGKTWDDVKSWYIKWDTIHILFNDTDNYFEISLDSDDLSVHGEGFKRPLEASVWLDNERIDDYVN